MKNDSAPKRSVLKRIAPLIMSVMMVFVMMPAMAFASQNATQTWIAWGSGVSFTAVENDDADWYDAGTLEFNSDSQIEVSYSVTGGQKYATPSVQTESGDSVDGASVTYSSDDSIATISGLSEKTSYRLFWQASKSNNNLTYDVYLTFTTGEAPRTAATQTWITWGTPTATWQKYANGADWYTANSEVAFDSNNDIVISYSVNKGTDKTPAVLQDENGNEVSGATLVDSKGASRTVTISGLSPDTSYRLFWEADKEDNKNLSNDVYLVFKTAAVDETGDYTVTFDSNGGSAVASQKVDSGEKAEKPDDPTKTGYSFVGWQLDGTAYDFDTAVTSDITLTAVWQLTGPTQGWISFTSPAAIYSGSKIVNDVETDFYAAGAAVEFDGAGSLTIGYGVIGQKNYLSATLRDANGNAISDDAITCTDSLGETRTVTITGLASKTEYQLYWPKLGANSKNPQRDVVLTFTTGEYDASAFAVSGIEEKYTYTGSDIKPEPVVKVGDTTLTKDTDYTLTYTSSTDDDFTNAGVTVTVTVTGKEGADYEGKSATTTYKINKASITSDAVSLPDGVATLDDGTVQYAYTGSEIKPAPVVKVGDRELEQGTDYALTYPEGADFVNADTDSVLTVNIAGKGNYKDGTSFDYMIVPRSVTLPTASARTYNAKTQVGIAANTYYDVTDGSAGNAGSYKATLALKDKANCVWSDGTTDDKEVFWSIAKAANPLTVKAKTAKIKYKKLKKKAQTLKVSKVINFTKKGQGTMTYTLSSAKKGSKSFKKYFKINKSTGKVTVKKKLKKGTYKVKVKVKAAGNSNYNASAVKTVTFKVKVK